MGVDVLKRLFFAGSPHKFVGGPGTPGILLMSKSIYYLKSSAPSTCGGGTVSFVNGLSKQAREVCACAAPYGHSLLNVGKEQSLAFRSAFQKGTSFKVIVEDEEQVEISFTRSWKPSLQGKQVPLNTDIRSTSVTMKTEFKVRHPHRTQGN
ncbi:hypothetical protein FRX31_011142 [Thalictrum thalictroides]|uniref:Uncharacterized protein n=1 Tax=Thalictrum thalictroides TaxID=46969 RepID=A0A7J6WPG8_THATH|nr:hypothetical protein FRX31_011142 [Thalictrum thalictroides]